MGHGPNSYDTKDMKKTKNTAQLGDRKQLVTMQRKGKLQKRMRREEGMWLKTYVCGQKERELV